MRIAFVFIFASALLVRAQEGASGRWEGTIRIPERELKVVVDLVQENGGAWIGSVIIPALNVAGGTLSDIALNGSDVTFSIKTALADQRSGLAKFSGHLAADGKLSGDFAQGGNSAPFSLEKIGPAQISPPTHSTAVAKEIEGEWKGEYELFNYPRKVTIKLQNRGAEGATAEFVILGKKENKLPVDLVTQEGAFLTIDSHETGLTFEGRVGKGEIKGTVLQGPLEIPVVMRRAK